jgi:predicted amidophosphoribosyltransferase
MTRRAIAERLESQSVLVIDCTIPPGATIAEWRRGLRAGGSARRSAPWLARLFHRRAARLYAR